MFLNSGGAKQSRTADPRLARAVLYQLSYSPTIVIEMVGLTGFEPMTSRLSGVRSHQLSYRPINNLEMPSLLRKEVIQPHLQVQLPCYDLTPIISHTLVARLLAVSYAPLGIENFRGVTGGVYKTRERIHRDILIRDY